MLYRDITVNSVWKKRVLGLQCRKLPQGSITVRLQTVSVGNYLSSFFVIIEKKHLDQFDLYLSIPVSTTVLPEYCATL